MEDSKKTKSTPPKGDKVTQSTVSSASFGRAPMGRRRLMIIAIVVVVVLAVGGYFTYKHFQSDKAPAQETGYQETIDQIKNTRPADNASPEERANYYSTLGAAYASAGKYDDTISALNQAEALYTQPADKYGIWYDLAKAYEAKGDKKKALDNYKNALNFAQNPPEGETKDSALVDKLNQKIKQLGG